MRLYLAVAVLMLAFVAYTEAQDASLGEQIRDFGRTLGEKAKTALENIRENKVLASSRNWLGDQFQWIREKIGQIQ